MNIPPHLSWADYLVVLGYLAAMVWMGFHFSRNQQNTERYFKGRGSIPAWALGISLPVISSVTFIAFPGRAYHSNWLLLVQGLMLPFAVLTMVWFIVPAYRHAIGISTYEYFEKRFSYAARLYASLAFFVVTFTKMGTITYLMALAIAGMTGWEIHTVIIVISVATVIYTWVGGLEAVVWTDVVQSLIFPIAGLVCIAILLFKPPGGPAAVISLAYENGKLGFGPYDLDFTRPTLIVMILNGLFYGFQNYSTSQLIVQRLLAAKDDRAAISATLTSVCVSIPVWLIFMFIGTCLWSFYKITQLPLGPNVTKADDVFPYFIITQLPPGMTGLVLAGLMAAAMSTLSSDLNCLSAVAVEDYYRRLRPTAGDKNRLMAGKAIVLGCGLVAIVISLIYVRLGRDSILEAIFSIYAIFSGGIGGLFALAFLTRRANRQGVLIGIITCVLFTAWALLTSPMKWGGGSTILLDLGPLNFRHDALMLAVYTNIVFFAAGYVGSLIFPAEPRAENLTIHGWIGSRHAIQKA